MNISEEERIYLCQRTSQLAAQIKAHRNEFEAWPASKEGMAMYEVSRQLHLLTMIIENLLAARPTRVSP